MHIIHDTIGAPKLKIEVESKKQAVLLINPLPSGFGMTIGNALRRTLLSSLPGTAPTAMKITGVTHEYTTIPGLKESVLELSLNIRELSLKKHSKGEEVVELDFVKSGILTAKDLKVSSDIEILEPSQIIAHCDGADPKTKMQLRVEKGVGYTIVTNVDNANEKDPENILLDANFSPVKQVKYEVTPARVGKLTNLDQLKLEVTTDGSLEAENAIKLSAEILRSYYSLFSEENAYTDEDFTISFSAVKQKEEEQLKAKAVSAEESFTPIDILGFSQRTLNALVNGGITSVEDLLRTPMNQLSQLRGFGQKAKTELEQVLRERGYLPSATGIITGDIEAKPLENLEEEK